MLSKQEIFNKVVRHLLTQNKKAMTGGGACYYYSKETELRCAVGCLFDPLIDTEQFENIGIEAIKTVTMSQNPDRQQKVQLLKKALFDSNIDCESTVNYSLLRALQLIHDAEECEYWHARLLCVGMQNGLDCSILGEFQ